MDRFLEDFLTILIFGGPGILFLVGAGFATRWKRADRRARWLLAFSMAVLGATWVWSSVYRWVEYCWETWQPCDSSGTQQAQAAFFTVSMIGLQGD